MDQIIVALPALATVVIAVGFIYLVWTRTSLVPIGEVGVSYVLAIVLYTCVPIVGYSLNGMRYNDVNDFRLRMHQPTPADIAELGWLFVAYMLAFALSYLSFRGKARLDAQPQPARPTSVAIAASLFICLRVYLLAINSYFGLSYTNYEEKLLIYSNLPLVLMQITSLVAALSMNAGMILLGLLFTDYRRYRWMILAFGLFLVVPPILAGHDRYPAVTVIIASVFYFHLFVRTIPPLRLGLLLSFILVGFLQLGYLRSGFVEAPGGQDVNVSGIVTHANEFESCFATAYDVYKSSKDGVLHSPPWQIYIADFAAVIPKQFLPFEKMESTTWYLDQFYPGESDTRSGWGFGVIAESAIGFGVPELILRGGIVGFMFAMLHRLVSRHGQSFSLWVIYIFVSVTCFRTLRSSTFELVRSILYYLVPSLLLITGIRRLGAPRRR